MSYNCVENLIINKGIKNKKYMDKKFGKHVPLFEEFTKDDFEREEYSKRQTISDMVSIVEQTCTEWVENMDSIEDEDSQEFVVAKTVVDVLSEIIREMRSKDSSNDIDGGWEKYNDIKRAMRQN